jgi:excisionase family DNA binding protein
MTLDDPRTPPALLLLEEVARELRVSVSTVRHWIAVGKLPSVRPGRRRMVRRLELEAFVAGDALTTKI